ncbi:hypothetical protein KXS11_01465 [Plantibacter flavus]|uniref:hypothetical protein n=1 Tax=Plantibacter flavus TaxID=150123 RepID=UPI003F18EF99
MKKNAALIGAIAVVGLLLTGCSGGAQSKADACKVIESEVTDSAAALQSGLSSLSSDPEGAVTQLDDFAGTFSAAADKVTNEEVKTAADASVDALNAFIKQAKTAVGDPASADQTALTDSLTKLQTEFTTLGTTCSL